MSSPVAALRRGNGPASLARTLGVPLKRMRHEFEDGHILLWWGPKVEVKHGDIIHYFQSLRGIEVEWVERPPEPAESEQSAPNVTTVRFS